MALNVALHNTDDHLKNIGFIEHVDRGEHMLRLSPVFDVLTQSSAAHYSRIGAQGRDGTIENVLSEPRSFMLTTRGAGVIVDRVGYAVERRNDFYEEAGMTERDMDTLNALISWGMRIKTWTGFMPQVQDSPCIRSG